MEPARLPIEPVKLFISYARADKSFRQKIEKHLAILQQQGVLSLWSDGELRAGQSWEQEILRQLEEADIILFLVSKNSLASEFINRQEVAYALEHQQAGKVQVIPVILGDCIWEKSPLAPFQALPTSGKPISNWDHEDQAFADVARGISRIVEDRQHRPAVRGQAQKKALEVPVATHLLPFPREPLRILGEDYDPFRAMKQVFDSAWKGDHPELSPLPIRNAVQFEGNKYEWILNTLRYAQPGHLPYDLVAIPYHSLGYCVEKGLLEELDDNLTRRHAKNFIWWNEMGMLNNKLYGVPLSALTMILAVRADLFNHFKLTPPDSWDDYVSLVCNREQLAPLMVAPDLLQGRCHITLWYDWLNYLYAYESNDLLLYRSQHVTINETDRKPFFSGTQTFLQVAAALAPYTLQRNHLPHYATANWDDGIEQFSRGNLLMHLVFNDALETMRQKMKVIVPQAEVRYLPIPRVFDGMHRHGQIEGWILVIPKGTRYYWPAIALLDWFLDEAVQRSYSRWGGASAHRLVINDRAEQSDDGHAFKSSIDAYLTSHATIDLVKCKEAGAFALLSPIIDHLYDAVLAVSTQGQTPQEATEMLAKRLEWYLRLTASRVQS